MTRPARAALLLALSGCAGPPLAIYTLQTGPAGDAGMAGPIGAQARVIAVSRVDLQDALDTQDILVRRGAVLQRSATGRWAERLSAGITDRITADLARRMPDALVTDQPQAAPVTARLTINVSRLDETSDGAITLAADWAWVPTDPALPVRRDRAVLRMSGATGSDDGTVALLRRAVDALAQRIDVPDGAAGSGKDF